MEEKKYWFVRDDEYSDGHMMNSYPSWTMTTPRWYAIRFANAAKGCRHAAIIDDHGNVEVIKFNGEVIASV